MSYDPRRHHRRSIRLAQYDYSQEGYYFITLCAQDRFCFFGEIIENKIHLNDPGEMIQKIWNALPQRFPNLKLDKFVLMPNHLHGIVQLHQHKNNELGTLGHSVGRVFQAFKSITTNTYIQGVKKFKWPEFRGRLWQRNYWEHVINDEYGLHFVREYINDNPKKWASDQLFSS